MIVAWYDEVDRLFKILFVDNFDFIFCHWAYFVRDGFVKSPESARALAVITLTQGVQVRVRALPAVPFSDVPN